MPLLFLPLVPFLPTSLLEPRTNIGDLCFSSIGSINNYIKPSSIATLPASHPKEELKIKRKKKKKKRAASNSWYHKQSRKTPRIVRARKCKPNLCFQPSFPPSFQHHAPPFEQPCRQRGKKANVVTM
ncbi:hypothetical protein BDR22DRAFT_172377 [Usnea florida]